MIVSFLQGNKLLRKLIRKLSHLRSKDMLKQIESYLSKGDKILDIGAGTCTLCRLLNEEDYTVTPLDVKNLSFVDEIAPIIYDGVGMPFKRKKFDTSLILTVLHHTSQPIEIIEEAKRVSNRIIIMEEVYVNTVHKWLTYLFDSLTNLKFEGHPHSNKSDKEWRKVFDDLNLKLVNVKYRWFWGVFRQAVYCVELDNLTK